MPELLHQTTRLSSGRHSSPDHGMCVAELASVLAGEPFTDHPASVSRVIASFLRTYNDRVDAGRRQNLVPYAALVVGTRADRDTERRRAARCMTWAVEELGVQVSRSRPRLRRLARRVPCGSQLFCEEAARWVAMQVPQGEDGPHRRVLRLLDDLVAIRPEPGPVSPRSDVELEPVAGTQPRRSNRRPARATALTATANGTRTQICARV